MRIDFVLDPSFLYTTATERTSTRGLVAGQPLGKEEYESQVSSFFLPVFPTPSAFLCDTQPTDHLRPQRFRNEMGKGWAGFDERWQKYLFGFILQAKFMLSRSLCVGGGAVSIPSFSRGARVATETERTFGMWFFILMFGDAVPGTLPHHINFSL